MSSKTKIFTAITLSMIFWAFSFIWYKEANRNLYALTIVFLRLVMAVIMMTGFLFVTKGFRSIEKKDRKLFLMMSVFEPFLYFIGESFGLTFVSATVGSVLISTIPVVATIGAWLIFKERLKAINYAGIILSFIGVIIFISNSNGTISFNVKGLMLMGLAVFSAVGYNLTLSRLVGSYSPFFIVMVQNTVGMILFFPLFLILDYNHFISQQLTFRMFVPVLELAIFASCGAFILFAWSVGKMGITRANVFTNFIPIFTALFAFFILDEKLSFRNVAGMAVVIAGIIMSQVNGREKKTTEEAIVLTGKTA
ncbi:MAG: DMT family transporter [Chloroflexota bacterium]